MPPTIRDLSNRFTYHPPTEAQQLKYTEIRGRALDFAERLVQLVPGSPELSTALTKLDELVMHANAGIARNTGGDPITIAASALSKAKPSIEVNIKSEKVTEAKPSIEVQSNSQGAAAFATDLVSLLQRVQSWRNGGGTGIYSPHLRDDFPDDLREGIATTLREARAAGGGTSALVADLHNRFVGVLLINLLQRVKEWRDGDGNVFFPGDLRKDIATTLGAAGDMESQKDAPVDPEASTVKTEPQRDLAAEIAAEDAAMDLLQRVKEWRDGEDNDAFPHGLREDIATVLPNFATDPIILLQRVQSWREGDDSNDCFPHGLRVDIATVLRASADTAVDAPVDFEEEPRDE